MHTVHVDPHPTIILVSPCQCTFLSSLQSLLYMQVDFAHFPDVRENVQYWPCCVCVFIFYFIGLFFEIKIFILLPLLIEAIFAQSVFSTIFSEHSSMTFWHSHCGAICHTTSPQKFFILLNWKFHFIQNLPNFFSLTLDVSIPLWNMVRYYRYEATKIFWV